MPSIQELLNTDLGAGSVKTASAQTTRELDSMDKLAMELGLFADVTEGEEKVAADDEEKKDESDEKPDYQEDEKKEEEGEKKASIGMDGLYSSFFGEDELATGEVKTAEEEKLAEYQESLGARAYDYFASRFETRIEKIASDMASGAIQNSFVVPQALPTDKAKKDNNGQKIDTTPQVQGVAEMKPQNDQASVGQESSKLAAAVRKHMLLAAIGQGN